MNVDPAEILVEGPWRHRLVSANGARFHCVEGVHPEAPAGPLVVLLHGFPQFWWAWRHQLPALTEAGYRVVAMDLRGYGSSDKPPRGYDTETLTADVAGVIRALGEQDAVVVGHDWGAWVAWACAGLQPRTTRAIAVLSMGHPLTMRAAMTRAAHWRTLAQVLAFQAPWLAERRLTGDGVGELIRRWWGDGTPDPEAVERYRRAMQLPFVATTSLEYFRRAARSTGRREARSLAEALDRPVTCPVLQLHGARDTWVLPSAAARSRRRVEGPLYAQILPGAGHFLPEEAPEQVTSRLLSWLADVAPLPGVPSTGRRVESRTESRIGSRVEPAGDSRVESLPGPPPHRLTARR